MRASCLWFLSLASFILVVVTPCLSVANNNPLEKQAQRQAAAEEKAARPKGMPEGIFTVNEKGTVTMYAMDKVDSGFRPEALKTLSKEERAKTEGLMATLYTTKQNLIDEVSAKNTVDRVAGSGTNARCWRRWGWGGCGGYYGYGWGGGYYGGWGGYCGGGYGNWGGYGMGYCGGYQPWSYINYSPIYTASCTTYVGGSYYGLGYGFNTGGCGYGVYYY